MKIIDEIKGKVKSLNNELAGIDNDIAEADRRMALLQKQPVPAEDFMQAVMDMVDAKAASYLERVQRDISGIQFKTIGSDRNEGAQKIPVSFSSLEGFVVSEEANPLRFFMGNVHGGMRDDGAFFFFFGEAIKQKLGETMKGMSLEWPESTDIGCERKTRRELIAEVQKERGELIDRKECLETEIYAIGLEMRELGSGLGE